MHLYNDGDEDELEEPLSLFDRFFAAGQASGSIDICVTLFEILKQAKRKGLEPELIVNTIENRLIVWEAQLRVDFDKVTGAEDDGIY